MTLPTRQIGKTDLAVSTLGFGCAPIGGLLNAVDESQARAALDVAWAGGVRFFDTAPFYGFGASERRTGDALRAHPREDYVLCTTTRCAARSRTACSGWGWSGSTCC